VVGRATLDAKDPRKLTVAALPPQADGGPAARWLINKSGGVDLHTEQKFGDGLYEVEFMVPRGSNSGIYLMGEYEVQILDSFGRKKVGPGDLGGLYGAAAPRVNAARAPGQWQRFAIAFKAPRFPGHSPHRGCRQRDDRPQQSGRRPEGGRGMTCLLVRMFRHAEGPPPRP
jgi:hypothetical protein